MRKKKSSRYQVTLPSRSLYNAAVRKLWGSRLLNPVFVVIYLLLIVALMIVFYPRGSIMANLNKQTIADKVAIQYLKQIIYYNPGKSIYKLELARQELAQGNFVTMLTTIGPMLTSTPTNKEQWNALYLYFSYLRVKTFAAEVSSNEREKYVSELNKTMPILLSGPYHYSKFVVIANTALSVENYSIANKVYDKILSLSTDYGAKDYEKFAKSALAVHNYVATANFYLLAMKKSEDLVTKRYYFIASLRALQAGGLLEQALVTAKNNIGELANDKETLFFISKLALSAGKAKESRRHILKVMGHEEITSNS